MRATLLKAAGLLGAAGCLVVACIQQESFFPGFPPVGSDAASASRHARARIDVYEVRLKPDHTGGFDAATLLVRAGSVADFEAALGELGAAHRIAQFDQPVDLEQQCALVVGSEVPSVLGFREMRDGQKHPRIRYEEMGCNVEWEALPAGSTTPSRPRGLNIGVSGSADARLRFLTADEDSQAGSSASSENGSLIVLTSPADDGKSGESIGYAARVHFLPQVAHSASTRLPVKPAAQAFQTHVLIDVFQVALDPASPPVVSEDSLKEAGNDAAGLINHLSKLGPTKLLFHGGRPLSLESRTVIKMDASCPIVMSKMRTTTAGRIGATVQYEDIGCIVELEGRWDRAEPTRGEAFLRMEVSSVDRSRVKIADDLSAPIFRHLQSHVAGPITTSKPMLLIAIDAGSTDEPAAAYVARIEFRRIPMSTPAAKADANRSTGPGVVDADISVFEVALKRNENETLTYDSLVGHAESFDALQECLNSHGAARLLSRFAQPIDLENGEKLEQTGEKPLPESSFQNKQGRIEMNYRKQKVGTKIEFQPSGDRASQGTAEFTMKLDASDMRDSTVKIGPDTHAPLFTTLDHQLTAMLDTDRPLVLLTVNATGGDGTAYAQVVRLALDRAPDSSEARP